MMEKMDKLDIYNNSAIILEKKTPKSIISWFTILIILLILLSVISLIKFNIYKSLTGIVYLDNDSTYFISELNNIDFPIYKNYKLYIEDSKYDYDVVSIEDGILKLKINLPDSLIINGNILTANILINRTTLLDLLSKKIEKGFGI